MTTLHIGAYHIASPRQHQLPKGVVLLGLAVASWIVTLLCAAAVLSIL